MKTKVVRTSETGESGIRAPEGITYIPNAIFENPNLGALAIRIISIAYSDPEAWDFSIKWMENYFSGRGRGHGRESIKKARKEIINSGLLEGSDKGGWTFMFMNQQD